MLTSKHYVPILKWKGAEQGALGDLINGYKEQITPLFELVMPKPKSFFKDKEKKVKKSQQELLQELITEFKTKKINEIPKEINNYWGSSPAFIDFSLTYPFELRIEGINKILVEANKLGLNLIPVMNLSDHIAIKTAIKDAQQKSKNSMCIRVVSSDLENISKLNADLEEITKFLGRSLNDLDLLIDIKDNSSNYVKYSNLSQRINNLTKWRSFIFASGSFPENLSECHVEEPKSIERVEWIEWLNIKNNKQTVRIPTFADYGIRNPIYNEALQFYHPTSSIKYTLEKEWFILKGKRKASVMYLASAALLVSDQRFYGEDFSVGDKFIAEKARYYPTYIKNPELKGTGNTEMWLSALLNHHLTATSHQIANL